MRRLVSALWLSLFILMTSCMHAHKIAAPPVPPAMPLRFVFPSVDCGDLVDAEDMPRCPDKI